jgi:hypothetical protein
MFVFYHEAGSAALLLAVIEDEPTRQEAVQHARATGLLAAPSRRP